MPRDAEEYEIKKAWKLLEGTSSKVWWSLMGESDWKLIDLLAVYFPNPTTRLQRDCLCSQLCL